MAAPVFASVLLILSPTGQAAASVYHLETLIETDELGYSCIEDEDLEAAFASAGKGAGLPQTCLPRPCEIRPSEAQLAELLGRDPTLSEFEDFEQRHDWYCSVKLVPEGLPPFERPVLKFFTGPPLIVPTSPPVIVVEPDSPPTIYLSPDFPTEPPVTGTTSPTGSRPLVSGPRSTPISTFAPSGGEPSGSPVLVGNRPEEPALPPVSPVPLPAPAAMLIAGLAALAVRCRRPRRQA